MKLPHRIDPYTLQCIRCGANMKHVRFHDDLAVGKQGWSVIAGRRKHLPHRPINVLRPPTPEQRRRAAADLLERDMLANYRREFGLDYRGRPIRGRNLENIVLLATLLVGIVTFVIFSAWKL